MKKIISTDKAPGAIGPYSQAVIANGFLFASGQIPLNAQGEFVQGDITVQATQCLKNIVAVLAAANLEISAVVKTTVFLQDMQDFAALNTVYSEYFQVDCPARSCYQVAKLPKDALVEIEIIAACK